jgi:Spy/CpxP family protein refolding chaperone
MVQPGILEETIMKHRIYTILRTTVVAWGLAAAAVFPQITAEAGGFRDDIEIDAERLAAHAALSAEQRNAVRAVLERCRPRMKQLLDEIELSGERLADLSADNSQNEMHEKSLADARAKAIAELLVLSTETRAEIDVVLTDEQRQQLYRSGGMGLVAATDRQQDTSV